MLIRVQRCACTRTLQPVRNTAADAIGRVLKGRSHETAGSVQIRSKLRFCSLDVLQRPVLGHPQPFGWRGAGAVEQGGLEMRLPSCRPVMPGAVGSAFLPVRHVRIPWRVAQSRPVLLRPVPIRVPVSGLSSLPPRPGQDEIGLARAPAGAAAAPPHSMTVGASRRRLVNSAESGSIRCEQLLHHTISRTRRCAGWLATGQLTGLPLRRARWAASRQNG